MAIGPTCKWEVRSTGSQNNGGGFTSGGTDYSQQDAAQDSGADLACADGDAASPVITSATHDFVAADVGNIIHITAGTGWTAGWYEIMSCADNAATLDRACGTDGAKTNGTWYLGGAFLIGGTLDDDWFDALTAGNTVYVYSTAGGVTYNIGENIANLTAGTSLLPIIFIGYNGTRATIPTGVNRPTINFAAYTCTLHEFVEARYIIFTSTAASGITLNGENKFYQCKFSNTSTTAARYAARGSTTSPYGASSSFVSCELTSPYGNGFGACSANAATADCLFINCYIHDCGVAGINAGVNSGRFRGLVVEGCIIDSCTTGITLLDNYNEMIINNTIRNCITAISATTAYNSLFINNIISDCYYGAVWTTQEYDNRWDFNCWNNNTNFTLVAQGANDVIDDPLLGSVLVSGVDGATNAGGTVFTAASAPFSGVTTSDYLVIKEAGTGATVGGYLISSVDSTSQLTLVASAGASKTGITYGIVKGTDFTLTTGSPCFDAGLQPTTVIGIS